MIQGFVKGQPLCYSTKTVTVTTNSFVISHVQRGYRGHLYTPLEWLISVEYDASYPTILQY